MTYLQLDRNNPISLYEQLKNLIKEQIKNGELKPNQQIPSERELCERYGISRITVRQAISLAIQEGLLFRTHGKGTFVAQPNKIKQGLTRVSTFQQTLSAQGMLASTKIRKSEFITNNLYLSRLLNTDISQPLVNLQLIGYGNEEPVVYYDSVFPQDLGQKMTELAERSVKGKIPFSSLDLYGKQLGTVPTHVEQTYEAIASNEKISRCLQIELGSPVLLVTSVIFADEYPLEYRNAYYRGDKYKFFILRQYESEMFDRDM